MIIKAGIVGPRDTVQLISTIAQEYKDKLISKQLIYTDTEEVSELLRQNQEQVDLWIFAGPALSKFIKESNIKQPFFILNLDGASLTKTLVDIGYTYKERLTRLSIDLLSERDVYETYHDLGIPSQEVYVHEFSEEIPLQQLLNFHLELYRAKKIDLCITSLYSIYEQLTQLEIPVYRVTPTRSNIRETLATAIQQWDTLHFKRSQIATIMIKIKNMEKSTDYNTDFYKLHRLNLALQTTILDFSESISGSFVPLGIGTYIIFSTRGTIQKPEHNINHLLENIALITSLSTNIGIGYGNTALEAEENARLALNHAQNYDAFSAFLVDSSGIIEGPLRDRESISYSYRNDNEELNTVLEKSGVSIATFNRLLSVQKRMGNHSLTAVDVADWLKMTPRNARRILNNLVQHGAAQIIGEEAPTAKGRPRKLYRVSIKNSP